MRHGWEELIQYNWCLKKKRLRLRYTCIRTQGTSGDEWGGEKMAIYKPKSKVSMGNNPPDGWILNFQLPGL